MITVTGFSSDGDKKGHNFFQLAFLETVQAMLLKTSEY